MSISGAGLFNIPRISCKKIYMKTIEIFPLTLFEGRSEVFYFDFVIIAISNKNKGRNLTVLVLTSAL